MNMLEYGYLDLTLLYPQFFMKSLDTHDVYMRLNLYFIVIVEFVYVRSTMSSMLIPLKWISLSLSIPLSEFFDSIAKFVIDDGNVRDVTAVPDRMSFPMQFAPAMSEGSSI